MKHTTAQQIKNAIDAAFKAFVEATPHGATREPENSYMGVLEAIQDRAEDVAKLLQRIP